MSDEYYFEVEVPGREYGIAEFCQKTECYHAALSHASEWMEVQVDRLFDLGRLEEPGEVSVTVRVKNGPPREWCVNCNPEPDNE